MLRRVIHRWERKLSRRDNNRKVWPFDWGLEFLDHTWSASLKALSGPGGEGRRPGRDFLFEFNRRAIAESDLFFRHEPVREYSFDGQWLTFESPLQTPYDENNTVHARYFPVLDRSKNGGGALRSDVERARGRAVIVLPQWNADGESHVALCRLINRVGIASLRLSMPYHDRRLLAGFTRAEYMVSANLGRTLQACRQAVMEVRAAVDWLMAQGYERVGIMGTSIGSCIGFLAFVHDERLRAGAFNHVSSYFGDVVWEGISTAHVRQGLESGVNREEARQAWMVISPNAYINRMTGDRRRGLFISARYDLSFTPELSNLLFEECNRHGVRFDKALVPWGHYTTGEFPFKYYDGYLIVNYLRRHL
ncbi:MAG TPA: abhydrolase domain-containing 18 [Blastocatellia bacterium]|nr:abhydrolase domain-containing 18 [Blastocatellia bacterium]